MNFIEALKSKKEVCRKGSSTLYRYFGEGDVSHWGDKGEAHVAVNGDYCGDLVEVRLEDLLAEDWDLADNVLPRIKLKD